MKRWYDPSSIVDNHLHVNQNGHMIRDSARSHGVTDVDMEHARRNWLVRHDLSDPQRRPFILYVGPDTAGRMIEVGVNADGDYVHAMAARRQYLPRTKQRRR